MTFDMPSATRLSAIALALFSFGVAASVQAQALNVVPVMIQMAAGQRASSLTVVNQGDVVTSFQLRAFRWSQAPDGSEMLVPSQEIAASPPLGTIAPGASQVIRIVVRPLSPGQESSYRLLLDQIPAPAAPGTVRIALRLSLPVFAQPAARTTPHLRFHLERNTNEIYLVAVNDGNRHEKLQDITLKTRDGTIIAVEKNISPYVLAGATRRWHLANQLASNDATLRLTAHAEAGEITDQMVTVTAQP